MVTCGEIIAPFLEEEVAFAERLVTIPRTGSTEEKREMEEVRRRYSFKQFGQRAMWVDGRKREIMIRFAV